MKNFPPHPNPFPDEEKWQPETTNNHKEFTNESRGKYRDKYTNEYRNQNMNEQMGLPDLSALTAQNSDAQPSSFSLAVYLVPVLGVFPSLWTLYNHNGTREQMAISRLSITLTLTWALGYLLLATGSEVSNFTGLRFMVLNGFFTSSYFLVSVWLIFRTLKGKTQRLPGISPLSRRIFKIHRE